MRIHGILPRLAVVAALLATACARPLDFESEPSAVYAVEVENPLAAPMVVYWRADGESGRLGTVAANARERFVVAGAPTPTVSIYATNEAGTRTTAATAVTLRPGQTVAVRLRS